MAKLENWTLHTFGDRDNQHHKYLVGIVYGHPKANQIRKDLIDGHEIRTSEVVSIDFEKHIAITQSGTVYELGGKDIEGSITY